METLEQTLREKLAAADMPVRKLAEETGIGYTHLNQFKNGKLGMSLRNLNILANYFDIRYKITIENH